MTIKQNYKKIVNTEFKILKEVNHYDHSKSSFVLGLFCTDEQGEIYGTFFRKNDLEKIERIIKEVQTNNNELKEIKYIDENLGDC